jgi:23S rRNA G2445 N2-methylase RlmL
MVPPRSPRADLAARVLEAGFTPSVRDVDALLDMRGDEALFKPVERAIARVGRPALARVAARLEALETSEKALRPLLIRVVGRLVSQGSSEGIATLVAALEDPDAKVRRNAAMALGRVRDGTSPALPGRGRNLEGTSPALPGRHAIEQALVDAWGRETRPEVRRAVVEALGKVGTEDVLVVLRQAGVAADPELSRIGHRAAMMVERTASRGKRGIIDATLVAGRPVNCVALSRRGLEGLLAEELSSHAALSDVRVLGPGRVAVRLSGPLDAVFTARTMLGVRFELPSEWVRDGDTVAEAIGRALSSEEAKVVLSTWTVGPVRYRIAWGEGGHRRAATWDAVAAIARRAPGLINDPTQSTWEVIVSENRRQVDVALSPRSLRDPRFSWRVADVPAASHPTIAAALARVAGARDGDVVWDPFVGSAGELIERALLGPYRTLIGTDVDARALAAARSNLAAAGLDARLEVADALTATPDGVTLIITNPPMGRRSSRTAALRDMLSRFVVHAASVLRPRGRLVWMTPWPAQARASGTRAGLTLQTARTVDLGGIDVELQHWVKS